MKYKIILFLLLVISQNSLSQERIKFSEIRPPFNTISPTISKLQKFDISELAHEVNLLWDRLSKDGAPLIEKDTLYDDYVFLTFMYRNKDVNKEISFEIFGIYDEYRLGDMKMYQLGNTDLFYRCYLIPDDLCFSYRFIVNDTVTGESLSTPDMKNNNLIPTGERGRYSWSVLDLRTDETDRYTRHSNNTGSKLDTFKISSNILDNTRDIYVYLPPNYNDDVSYKYPVIYLFDSFIYLHRIEVPNVLDNLIQEGKIEPMIAVMMDNPTPASRKYELPLNPSFKDFMVHELVPYVRGKYRITDNPDKTVIGGISYGGLASAYIAFFHPDIFGRVLSQSGSFWRDLELTDCKGAEYRGDWLINRYLTEENKKLKIFLDWGLQENMCLSSGRSMAKVLDKKGYKCKFVEFNGWHDWSNSRKTFPEGLIYLLDD